MDKVEVIKRIRGQFLIWKSSDRNEKGEEFYLHQIAW